MTTTTTVQTTWELDAKLFGILESGNEKSYRALLCARCVKPRAGQGRKDSLSENSEKVSANRFATVAGISDKTIAAYIRTWDGMAKDGMVPQRSDLTPGVDVELPDKATFTKYYRQANPSPVKVQEEKTTEDTHEAQTAETSEVPTPQPVKVGPDVKTLVSELSIALSGVKPQKTSQGSYDRAVSLLQELSKATGAQCVLDVVGGLDKLTQTLRQAA